MAGQKRQLTLQSFALPSKKSKTDNGNDKIDNGDAAAGPLATIQELPGKIASFDAAAAVDANPPLKQLLKAMEDVREVQPGEAVVYWMRMEDMRGEAFMNKCT